MKFKTFPLDHWLQQHADAEFNLDGSTGPRWTARELLELSGHSDHAAQQMLGVVLHYPPTAGASALRKAIAEMQGVPEKEVSVFAGGAEALFHMFRVAAGPLRTVFIATRNSFASLPPELRRRSTLGTFLFDLRTPDEREAIWTIYVAKYGVSGDSRDDEGSTGAKEVPAE